ncbi:DUF7742 family protein [Loktanella sp. Alg231-35]|uniref:DUF7742 family protein n=1 Tax=Loktanella sp. Alg231-35 TaxID=1922220 RepID=UPI00131EE491|nr:hypothetical protein [Loktanella sp. Alg231-35]
MADIEIAARALLAVDAEARAGVMTELLRRADIADRYRKKLRRPHVQFGTGTLMSAASRFDMAPRPTRISGEVQRAYAIVINALGDQSA